MTPVTKLALAIAFATQMQVAVAQQAPKQDQGAQDAAAAKQDAAVDPTTLDTIVVTGARATQRNSIAVKRDATVIVDALINEEIGALPDNSVAETLERITGVTADRFKGSASEISIRGLGPYLGFSTLNGREVSSGSGDRAVSFQQFPSELTNGVLVYKSQQADFVEGGISGVIELKTVRPLDYGKQRFQAEVRGNYLPYADRAGEDLGSRLSASYVDQFKTGIGDIGVALGVAATDTSAPEDFYTSSSNYRPCNSINGTPTAVSGSQAGNCSYKSSVSNPVYFVPNGFNFRQLNTEDKRRAFTGNVQWKPNELWDINLDMQVSKRESHESRHDLAVAEGRRGIVPITLSPDGALLQYAANSYLESQAAERQRDESYRGGGVFAKYKASDTLTISGDLSSSRTHRNQLDFGTRLRSNTIFGPSGRVAYTADQSSSDIPIINFVNPIDLNNHAAYTGNAYARRGLEDRVDEVDAARLDFAWDRYGVWSQFQAGVRYSDHTRVTDLDNDNNLESIPTALTLAGNTGCRIDGNSVQDWGKDSGTNITSWAQFDARCLYRAFTGSDDLGPLADSRSASDIDVRERIAAAYVMGSFSTEMGDMPVSGNLGVRFVDTRVRSGGFRGAYTLQTTIDPVTKVPSYRLNPVAGSFDPVTIKHGYRDVLPSFNVNFGLRENLFLRGAVYKAISRSNIEDLGAGRTLITDGSASTPEEALAGASGGNPRLEPLESWNGDLSLEYYPNQDTSYSAAFYYKTLKAGVVPSAQGALNETFVIDGVTYNVPVAQQTNSSDSAYLAGFELGFNRSFSNLPAPFNGLGLQGSYSYTKTDFEYPDPSAVDPNNPLANFTNPLSYPGLSRNVGSLAGYFEYKAFNMRLVYKYRSDYFKPFQLNANRFVDSAGYLDLSMGYDINKHVQIKLQAININNEHQLMYRPVEGSIAEASYFGPSYFLGVRFRY